MIYGIPVLHVWCVKHKQNRIQQSANNHQVEDIIVSTNDRFCIEVQKPVDDIMVSQKISQSTVHLRPHSHSISYSTHRALFSIAH